tara:strand:- start:122 stop:697 length:576 start_codon:yes stop_codon:yes gene_type:complete
MTYNLKLKIMTRLRALDPQEATGRSKELFDGIQAKLGMVPNMMRTMGNSSAVLEGYLNLGDALGKGTLGGKLGELIALAVAEDNACNYCLSAHSFIGEKLANIDTDSLQLAREGKNNDPKVEAALIFAKSLVQKGGRVSNSDVEAIKLAGYTDGAIGEIVAHVALNILTNYFNNTAETEIDFPVVTAAIIQ